MNTKLLFFIVLMIAFAIGFSERKHIARLLPFDVGVSQCPIDGQDGDGPGGGRGGRRGNNFGGGTAGSGGRGGDSD